MTTSELIAGIQLAVVVVSAGTAIALLVRTRTDARRAALLAILNQHRADPRWVASVDNIFRYTKRGGTVNVQAILADQTEFASIIYFLDIHEQMALSIYYGAVDEKLYKAFVHGNYIDAFEIMLPLIEELRRIRSRPSLYEFYQFMVQEWRKAPPPPPNAMRMDLQ
jgi:hypothetical protein